MKFAKQLEAESVAEWRRAYINYKGLKKRLKAIERYRKANERAFRQQVENAVRSITPSEDARQSHSTSVRYVNTSVTERPSDDNSLKGSIGTSSSLSPPPRPKRYNTTPVDMDDYRQDRRDSFSRTVLHRISTALFRDETEMSRITHTPGVIESTAVDEIISHASEPERYFFTLLDQDLDKISRFYNEKEKEAEAKFDALKLQLSLVRQYQAQMTQMAHPNNEGIEHRLNPFHWFQPHQPFSVTNPISDPVLINDGEHHMSYRVARNRLKKALTEYYRSLELLQSYKVLNKLGFLKILKKFDKTAGWKASVMYTNKLNHYYWYTSDHLDETIKDTERLYVTEFADGHRRRGMKRLRAPDQDGDNSATAWRVGVYLGLAIAIFIRVFQLTQDPEIQQALPNMFYNLQIYSFIWLPILFVLGFSVNMLVWHRCHINYKFIFELNPRNCLHYQQFAEIPCVLLLLTAIVMYIDFSQCFAPTIPSQLCPLILIVILLAILLCPFHIFYNSARQWFGITMCRILFSGLLPVEFRDFFIADELNSMAFSLWMSIYFFCVYGWHWNDLDAHCNVPKMWISPMIAALPPFWRLLQCFRRYYDSGDKVHLINGMKYVTSILATALAGIRRINSSPAVEAIWMLMSLVNSSYTSIWDIKMDWGLLDMSSYNFLLRDELVFYRWTYYVAMPLNVLLRFSWAVNKASLVYSSQTITFLTALMEAFRRFVWNFYRMENEHLNNCGNYRAIKEIPLPFALQDVYGSSVEDQVDVEEGPIRLSSDDEVVLSPTHLPPNALAGTGAASTAPGTERSSIDLGRAPALKKTATLVSQGSFYGRRDFESRADRDDTNSRFPTRQGSMVGQVLERIRTYGAPQDDSEEDSEGDDDEDSD